MVRIRSRPAGGDSREVGELEGRRSRWLVLIALLAVMLAGALVPAAPARAQPVGEEDERYVQHAVTVDSAEARALAERYRPIVMVREQEKDCDDTGEPYLPVPVELVLGNPDVTLRQNTGGSRADDPVLVSAPNADDLAAAGPDTYLDFPGNPRNPGCTYERWFRSAMDGHEPAVYARVAEADTGQVVVQYHLFYVFNDFNNTHESDWEMAQLLFDVPTVAEALSSGAGSGRLRAARRRRDGELGRDQAGAGGGPHPRLRVGGVACLAVRHRDVPRLGRERHRVRLRQHAGPGAPGRCPRDPHGRLAGRFR